MLSPQQELPLSEYSSLYDIVVPQDNLLRRINDLVDFTFVYQELANKYCKDNGRTAESPIRMFKYLLLKTIYDISDVDVVERSRYDMSFKYFLGMAPEEDVINASSLCKFRKLRLEDMDLMNLLIQKSVEIAIEKGIIKSRTIIVDATHTEARSNPYSPIEILRLRSKQLRKVLYAMDDNIKQTLPSKNKEDDLAHELDYTKDLLKLITSDASLSEVPAVKQRLNMLKETLSDIEAKLHPAISHGLRKDEDKFDYNKDAGMFVCPAGHMAIRKARQGKKDGKWNQSMTYFFDIEKCKTCSRREGCYKEGAKSKTYSIPIRNEEQKRQLGFQKSQEFKDIARQRYKIEAKNAELKQVYGYDKALSYGLDGMQMQGAMTIFAANIKRILKLS